eukprot:TRINITY_DN2195_c0_g1_i3.p1 TRINITY_DN2195_c0_g1~~TRINITY_DN2195_c0_g1_i3.p1  ORF type:complete len:194 (-),score=15.62 TRINITY_DN2195_c0_g1_i3:30-611(-)
MVLYYILISLTCIRSIASGEHGESWPDGDMLPLGVLVNGHRTSLSEDEQLSLFSLWCIFRNPLIFGGNLLELDEFTMSILSNPEVISINQASSNNRQLWANKVPNVQAWAASGTLNSTYVALFNLGETTSSFQFSFADVDLTGNSCFVRDLWLHKDLGQSTGSISVSINSHGVKLFQLMRCYSPRNQPPKNSK